MCLMLGVVPSVAPGMPSQCTSMKNPLKWTEKAEARRRMIWYSVGTHLERRTEGGEHSILTHAHAAHCKEDRWIGVHVWEGGAGLNCGREVKTLGYCLTLSSGKQVHVWALSRSHCSTLKPHGPLPPRKSLSTASKPGNIWSSVHNKTPVLNDHTINPTLEWSNKVLRTLKWTNASI